MALNLPVDEHLAAIANRRRIAEEQRKARIFNPRERLIGVDVNALNYQVHRAKLTKEEEQENERALAEQLRRNDRVALLAQKQQSEQNAKRDKEVEYFWKTEQRKEQRREFDLSDPDKLKKEVPTRVSDEDPRLGISSLQILEGEDLEREERLKAQKMQNRDWLQRQMLEKRLEMDRRNTELRNLELRMQQLDRSGWLMGEKEFNARRITAQNISEYNMHLATQRREQEKQRRLEEDLQKMQDIYNTYFSDLLSEDTSVARSSFGPHRVVPDRYKGMSQREIEVIFQKQKEQIQENKLKKDLEQEEYKRWDQLQLEQARLAALNEREEKRKQTRINRERLVQNHDLAREQNTLKHYLENVVYTNSPTEDYFTQFNTTTR